MKEDHQKEKILQWLSPNDFASQQSDLIDRRQEGTGQWFLESKEFVNWVNGSQKTLLCQGIPGAGKTMLAAIAVNYLSKLAQTSPIEVAFVYCNHKAQIEQTATYLLAAILQQVVCRQSPAPRPLEQLYEAHIEAKTRPSLGEIFDTLKAVLTTSSTLFIIVDALDECTNENGTRSQLLDKLCALQSDFDVRLLATSRLLPQVQCLFDCADMLEIRASEEDIKRYVNGQIYRLPRCIKRDSELQEEILIAIIAAVDGMFVCQWLF